MKPHPVDWVDFPALLRQLVALPVFDDTPSSVRRGVTLDVGRGLSWVGVSGHAAYRKRGVRLTVQAWATAADIAEALLHELVHLSLAEVTLLSRAHHGERFRRTLARAAREAWGIDVDPNPPARANRIAAYVLDDNIEAALMPLIESGAVVLPTPTPVSKPTRAAATEALIARRADHAAKMLARAERRVRQARTIHTKWAQKVRYYERVAAKRGQS